MFLYRFFVAGSIFAVKYERLGVFSPGGIHRLMNIF